jgi:TatD DNase family protein
MVDSHCHLDGERFVHDLEAVLDRAHAAGVERMLSIGTGDGPPGIECALEIAVKHATVFATVGVHPHDADKYDGEVGKRLAILLSEPKVLALGEIGLDFHYEHSPRDVQKAAFIEQMQIAADARRPIIIHTREAWPDTFALLERYWRPTGLGGIMHCFSGGPGEAQRCLDLGFHLSFAGIVTFPKSLDIQAACHTCPDDRLLIETDAPFLAPVPFRGKRNEPAYVAHTAAKVAELRGVDISEIVRITTANFDTLLH